MVDSPLPGWKNPDSAAIEAILRDTKVVAVVGLSADPDRPSFRVASFLLQQGFDIIPINPGQKEILGRTCYPDLPSVGRPIDLVDIFRKGEATPPIVSEALALGVKYIWLQEGVVSEESYALAAKAGRPIVMDRCLLKEYSRLGR
ncbi:MAG: CoA-binding protein [candidate division Zixibacteria bacterium]|nr:CoA-binding protein [candidate division Zixibacteria bacterium]